MSSSTTTNNRSSLPTQPSQRFSQPPSITQRFSLASGNGGGPGSPSAGSSSSTRFSSILRSNSASQLTLPSSSGTANPFSQNAYPTGGSGAGAGAGGSMPTVPTMASIAASGSAKRTNAIYERHVNRTRGGEVNLSTWEFFFSEVIQYTQKRVTGIGDFEKKLNTIGYRVGIRLVELYPLRDSSILSAVSSTSYLTSRSGNLPPTRILRLLPALSYIHTTLYKHLFGRPADSLEKSTENDDEYMLGDNNPVLTRGIEVPKEMSSLSCMALLAGVVEAVMDGMGFPSRVTAHNVPTDAHPRRCVILIKLDRTVMEREAAMSGK